MPALKLIDLPKKLRQGTQNEGITHTAEKGSRDFFFWAVKLLEQKLGVMKGG